MDEQQTPVPRKRVSSAGHSPLPWAANYWRVCHSAGDRIGVICDTASTEASRTPENLANAKFIERSCNNFESLLGALEVARRSVQDAIDNRMNHVFMQNTLELCDKALEQAAE